MDELEKLRGEITQLEKKARYYQKQVERLSAENLKLDSRASGLRREAEQRKQAFNILAELNQSIGTDQALEEIFQTVIEAIVATIGMDRALFLVPTDHEDKLRVAHWAGYAQVPIEAFEQTIIDLEEGFIRQRKTLLVNRQSEMDETIEAIRERLDLPYFAAVPVFGEDRLLGLLLAGRMAESFPLYPPLHANDIDTLYAIGGLITAVHSNMTVSVLKEMDRVKNDLFANISHEFRTPVTLTLGPLEGLRQERYGPITTPMEKQIKMMQRNQQRLLSLINQILDLAKLESGQMKLHAAQVPDLNDYLENLIERFSAMAEKKGVKLSAQLTANPETIDLYLDLEKFEKVCYNLLSNALKFTDAGSVTLSTDRTDKHFILTVSDTGMGIKEAELPAIFERFGQAESSRSNQYAGTGIGLALVQEIVHLHGGTIEVKSTFGSGTSFTLKLPLGCEHLDKEAIVKFGSSSPQIAQPATHDPIEEETAQEGLTKVTAWNTSAKERLDPDKSTLLYVEDNADLREYMHDLLGGAFNLFFAVDGVDGLEKARELQPDLVISDQMMPRMKGSQMLQELRTEKQFQQTPFILLTAEGRRESRLAGLQLGVDDYINKPFDEAELLARIHNLLSARRNATALAQAVGELEAINHHLTEEQKSARQKQLSGQMNELEGDERFDLRLFCRSSDILCGDSYSLHKTRDGGALIYVIDGMGHGILPSLTVFAVAASIRRHVGQVDSLAELMPPFLEAVRPALAEEEQLSYALFWLSPDLKSLDYAIGGLYPPLVQDGTQIHHLKANNFPLMNFTPQLTVTTLPMVDFQKLLIYTDGLVEDSVFEMGHSQIEEILDRPKLDRLLTQMENHQLEDDVTVIHLTAKR